MSTKKIELEQDEELIVTHKGSAYIFQIRIGNYHDLNIKKINAYTITTAQKKALDKNSSALDIPMRQAYKEQK